MKFLILLFVIGCAVALPRSYYKRYAGAARLQAAARPRRAPVHHRTMLISGYYRPVFAQRRQSFEPETAMTAFATGDSVAAGSYLGSQAGPNCVSCDTAADQENTEFLANPEGLSPQAEYDQTQSEGEGPAADYPEIPLSDPSAQNDEVAEIAPSKPARTPKRKPSKKVKPEPEDDEVGDESDEPAIPKRNRGPYNSFFPIVFGGTPAGRSGGGGGGAGGVTAIANSYSTGKGGVATSHATAYGGGPPSRPRKRTEQADADADEE